MTLQFQEMEPMVALTAARLEKLETLATTIEALRSLCEDAVTTDVLVASLTEAQYARLCRQAYYTDEEWVVAGGPDSQGRRMFWAVDSPSSEGKRRPMEAVAYPEMHTRLVSWWLVHAWRLLDLAQDTLSNLQAWRISVAAVTARALMEEVGCLLYEVKAIADGWSTAKALHPVGSSRAYDVRESLVAALDQAAFGTRLAIAADGIRATNVLTYVQKLARTADNERVLWLYDLLSDAAHPAWGARIAMASQPVRHVTGATWLRFYSRRPVSVANGSVVGTDFTVAHAAADALIEIGELGCDLLDRCLRVVDDFGLTTGAAMLTEREYWRNFAPVRGSRACPCGRGKWNSCGHRWGSPAPGLGFA